MILLLEISALLVILFCGIYVLINIKKIFMFRKSHSNIVDMTENIADSAKIAAVVASCAAFFLTPVGLFSLFFDPPFVVVIAPSVIIFSSVAIGLAIITKRFSYYLKKK